jgi:hypothetical protein
VETFHFVVWSVFYLCQASLPVELGPADTTGSLEVSRVSLMQGGSCTGRSRPLAYDALNPGDRGLFSIQSPLFNINIGLSLSSTSLRPCDCMRQSRMRNHHKYVIVFTRRVFGANRLGALSEPLALDPSVFRSVRIQCLNSDDRAARSLSRKI